MMQSDCRRSNKFQLTIGEEDEPQSVSDEYTNYTQNLISEQELQIKLKEVDDETPLIIEDASYPVTPPVEEITPAPTSAPTDDKNKIAGPIVGGVFGAILLCAIVGYFATKGCPFELPSFLNRGGGRVEAARPARVHGGRAVVL